MSRGKVKRKVRASVKLAPIEAVLQRHEKSEQLSRLLMLDQALFQVKTMLIFLPMRTTTYNH